MNKAMLLSILVPLMAVAEDPVQSSSTAAPTNSSPTPTISAGPTSPSGAAKPAVNPLASAVQARTPEAQAAQSGFQLATTLDHYLGTGTFVDARYYASLSAFLTIAPQYLFAVGGQRLVASATLRGSYEYTLPDNETGRHWSTTDTRLSVSAPALLRETALTNIAFSPSLGLTVPTSLESWHAGLITAVSVGVTMSRSVATVDFRANVSGSRSFFGQGFNGVKNPDPANAPGGSVKPIATVLCRPNEAYCAFSNPNNAWSLAVGGQVQWRATGSFLLYLGYTYMGSWRNAATLAVDDATPKALDSNGNPVAKVGMGRAEQTASYLGGSYQLNEHYSLDLGVSTVQRPLSPTGKVRFPFLALGNWADNATSFYFTLSAAY